MYLNGKQRAAKKVAGNLSNWDGSFPLVLANERTSDRPWLGEIHLVAIYHRALNSDEVLQNFRAGRGPESIRTPPRNWLTLRPSGRSPRKLLR